MTPISLLTPVRSIFEGFNWENRATPRLSLAGIPTPVVMREWSVEQFFSAMPWIVNRDPVTDLPQIYEEDPQLTLASFADLF